MYTQKDFETIRDIVVKDVPSAVGVILFGSYANGTAREGSDIDIAVLLRTEPEWRERHEILNRIYRETAARGYTVDFILKREEKYISDSKLPTVSREISRKGKVLWAKSSI